MQHGKGEEKWADGSTFVGYYSQGKKLGPGKLCFADGSIY